MIIADPSAGEVPSIYRDKGIEVLKIPMITLAKAIPDGRSNMVALGLLAHWLGLSATDADNLIYAVFSDKGDAVAAEVPVTVVNVMRGGPSTGIPTKSEQSDLNVALYGLHGDAPHLVLGALDHADCILTTEWAVRLSEALQALAVVLSDQYLAQSRVLISKPNCQLPKIPLRSIAKNTAVSGQHLDLSAQS